MVATVCGEHAEIELVRIVGIYRDEQRYPTNIVKNQKVNISA